jgi:hypothetical protein
MSDHDKALRSALELERSGDWDAAHKIAQGIESPESYGIHAYLHRKEGDEANAQYWYRRAGKAMPTCSLETEWSELHARLAGE